MKLPPRVQMYRQVLPEVRRNSLWVTPGLFFILLGLASLLAPQLVIAVVATFCLFIGVLLCFVGWKCMQLKAKVEKAIRQFDGRIFVQGVEVQPNAGHATSDDQKKIVFH